MVSDTGALPAGELVIPAGPHTPSYVLSQATWTAMYAQARREFPRECCGFVLVDAEDPRATQLVCCVNLQDQLHALDPLAHPRNSEAAYHIGGGELLRLVRSFDTTTPAALIYHSHPRVGAYFSHADIEAATAVEYPVDYLVIDVQADDVPCAKIYRRHPDSSEFEEIAVLPGAQI